MKQSTKQSTAHQLSKAPAMLLGLMLMFASGALGLQATAASADAENIQNINQTATEIMGSATGPGAISGPAVTFNIAPVQQMNIQIIAGDEFTQANSTQTATNTANVDQDAVAASGDTDASGGGIATSGPAIAGSIGVVHQLNVQVIAGLGCAVDQVASNTADLDQQAGAGSGGASAADGGSASSGSATAVNVAGVSQGNVQVYVCMNGSSAQQTAENIGDFSQSSGALSGGADAIGGSATTGAATASSGLQAQQSNVQVTAD